MMRIASLAPSVTIMLQEMGAADQIVACTSLCPLSQKERRAKTVGTFSVLREEKIGQARPDLVVTATLVQAKGAARLKEAGYEVLHLDPRRLSDIAKTYQILGERVGKADEGEKLGKGFLKELGKFKGINRKRIKVYMEEWPASSAGKPDLSYVAGNWVPDMVALAGGESVLVKPGEPSRQVTLDELKEADPDVIVQHVCQPPIMPESPLSLKLRRVKQREIRREQLIARPGWGELRAVAEERVVAVDDTPFNTPTLKVLQGVEDLRRVLWKTRQGQMAGEKREVAGR